MALKRKFLFNGQVLPDPGPQFSPTQVKDMYSVDFPELTTAAITFNDPKEGVQQYDLIPKEASKAQAKASGGEQTVEFKSSIGRKG